VAEIARISCPHCGAPCFQRDLLCWQCHRKLHEEEAEKSASGNTSLIQFGDAPSDDSFPILPDDHPSKGSPSPSITSPLIQFEGEENPPARSSQEAATQEAAVVEASPLSPSDNPTSHKMAQTLTGEWVEIEEPSTKPSPILRATAQPSESASSSMVAAQIGGEQIEVNPSEQVLRLTFCKNCGHQNDEEAVECRKCKTPLEVVSASSIKEIEAPPRAWGFDLLGLAWIVLGFSAVYCGQFLLKTDVSRMGYTWADYFWTGLVVCVPGIFIFMRHYFSKILFWVMTFGSVLVWSVIGIIWILGHLRVSDNDQVALIWLALLSTLSLISWITVRQNDDFDFGS
jgi:uncharacterized OB-fold protein